MVEKKKGKNKMSAEEKVGYVIYITDIDGGWFTGMDETNGIVNGFTVSRRVNLARVISGKEFDEAKSYLEKNHYNFRAFQW